MVPIFYKVGDLLMEAIHDRVRQGDQEIDMAVWLGRTALELIGQGGLGYSFGHLVEDEKNEYAVALRKFPHAIGSVAALRRFLPYLPTIRFAGIGRRLLEWIPHDGVRSLIEISDILWDRSLAIYTEKKHALEQGDVAVAKQIGEGKDIMSILLKANMDASDGDKLDEDELIGQMKSVLCNGTLILAAVDTTSSALSTILWRLSENPEVQQRLREEVISAGVDEGLEYDSLMGLPYLEAVCRETLRLARRDIVLPLSKPITGVDGKAVHEILVPKDTTVVVGLLNCNREKSLWGEDAHEWKPERWLSPLPPTLMQAKIPGIYSNLMTFLGGGRACMFVTYPFQ
ncbi:hypothetical protein BN946_scf184934.g10 [Trametes cinnabarina]|uniref:Cytochrome P450 n=1 Tax=Pycnoporus cinnabarinus TaxID=5643 RepID=A0A060SN66_PYCCI|nr:hypothetical protein BN946_scf184934.g10 [Trametes cinnabarina]